jgi:hypothetical protein
MRRHHDEWSDTDTAALLFLSLTMIVYLYLCVVGVIRGKYGVSAHEKMCNMVYVRSVSGKFINLYSDSTLITPIANPFAVLGDKYEIHTAGVGDLKIEEFPCR